jgi:hypothetical protein
MEVAGSSRKGFRRASPEIELDREVAMKRAEAAHSTSDITVYLDSLGAARVP